MKAGCPSGFSIGAFLAFPAAVVRSPAPREAIPSLRRSGIGVHARTISPPNNERSVANPMCWMSAVAPNRATVGACSYSKWKMYISRMDFLGSRNQIWPCWTFKVIDLDLLITEQICYCIRVIHCKFCNYVLRRPNAWVNRATAKPPPSWARPAEQSAPSQAKNAAAVASVATSHARRGIPPPENISAC
jgi:hypothetical protein